MSLPQGYRKLETFGKGEEIKRGDAPFLERLTYYKPAVVMWIRRGVNVGSL